MTANAHLGMLNNAMQAIGADYPRGVKKALADRERLTEAVRTLAPVQRDQVTAAVADALLGDRDPFADDAVLRITLKNLVTGGDFGLEPGMRRHAEERVVQAVTDNAPAILETLREAGNAVGAQLVKAHQILGGLPLDSDAAILKLGPVAAEAWADAKRGLKVLDAADRGWVALATLTGFANPSTHKVHRLAEVDLDIWQRVGHRPDSWSLIQAGATIDLATAETAKTRERRLQDQREGIATATERETQRRIQRHLGFAVPQ